MDYKSPFWFFLFLLPSSLALSVPVSNATDLNAALTNPQATTIDFMVSINLGDGGLTGIRNLQPVNSDADFTPSGVKLHHYGGRL